MYYYHTHLLKNSFESAPSFRYLVTVGAGETISLPMFNGDDSLYDFVVDFGDGTGLKAVNAYADADREHTYTNAGTFEIRIPSTGTFDYIKFADSPNSIIELKEYGSAGVGADSFLNCVNLETISALDSPSIHTNTLSACFSGCSILDSQINIVAVGVVSMLNMFNGASQLNSDINLTSTSSVTNMASMFFNATAFNKDLSALDVSAVTIMEDMMRGATAFNSSVDFPDTSALENTKRMFRDASSFDQSLAGFNITSLTDATDMLLGVTLSTANYDALLISWEAQAELLNVPFNGGNSLFTKSPSAAETARSVLIATSNWTITDGGPTA